MDKYSFRLADNNDISEIVDIYHRNVGTPGCTWDSDYPCLETAEADIKNKSLYVLEDPDKIIAVASAGSFDELGHLPWALKNPCELARIGVVPDMHNRGIGTIILKNVISAVKERGYDGIRMLVSKTNLAALAMYDKNGFSKCGETFMFDIDFFCYQIIFN